MNNDAASEYTGILTERGGAAPALAHNSICSWRQLHDALPASLPASPTRCIHYMLVAICLLNVLVCLRSPCSKNAAHCTPHSITLCASSDAE
eukprot:scaffold149406_cov15-Tisochrysis_lutea.AAC.1